MFLIYINENKYFIFEKLHWIIQLKRCSMLDIIEL